MYNSTGQGSYFVVLHYVFQSFYVNIQLSKNINWLYSGVHCPTSFVLLSLHLHYYYMQLLSEILQLFNFFLPLVTSGILSGAWLLYFYYIQLFLKCQYFFKFFLFFFVPSFAVFTFIICTPIKFYAYFLNFFSKQLLIDNLDCI